jgi:hypothetical protein
MRNLLVYPLTIAEICETLARMSVELDKDEIAPGDMRGFVLEKTIKLLRNLDSCELSEISKMVETTLSI